jgi:hypothetical protein
MMLKDSCKPVDNAPDGIYPVARMHPVIATKEEMAEEGFEPVQLVVVDACITCTNDAAAAGKFKCDDREPSCQCSEQGELPHDKKIVCKEPKYFAFRNPLGTVTVGDIVESTAEVAAAILGSESKQLIKSGVAVKKVTDKVADDHAKAEGVAACVDTELDSREQLQAPRFPSCAACCAEKGEDTCDITFKNEAWASECQCKVLDRVCQSQAAGAKCPCMPYFASLTPGKALDSLDAATMKTCEDAHAVQVSREQTCHRTEGTVAKDRAANDNLNIFRR